MTAFVSNPAVPRLVRRFLIAVWLCAGVLAARPVGALAACANTTVPSGNVTYVYDVAGRLTAVVNWNGSAATYQYDGAGNVVAISNPTAAVSVLGVSLNSSTCATIYGTGFSSTPSQNTVTFNGSGASVQYSTPTTIVVSIAAPSCSPTCNVSVSVSSPNGSGSGTFTLD